MQETPSDAQSEVQKAAKTPQRSPTQSEAARELLDGILEGPAKRAIYYRFVHVMLELLEKHNIRYFAHSGTMLGCVRHKGFVPWDDDVDFMIPEEDEPALAELAKTLGEYGIRVHRGQASKPADGIWQFTPYGTPIMGGLKKYMGFDIFIGEEITLDNGDRVYHYQSSDFRRWYKKRYVKVDDVFPRKRYPFGPLSVWGMRDPAEYFARSQFTLDSATIHVHKPKRALADEIITKLEEIGCYPIRDPDILGMISPYNDEGLFDLDHYRIPAHEIEDIS